jgi:hypothetical protein
MRRFLLIVFIFQCFIVSGFAQEDQAEDEKHSTSIHSFLHNRLAVGIGSP